MREEKRAHEAQGGSGESERSQEALTSPESTSQAHNRAVRGREGVGRLGGREQQEVLVASSAAQVLEDGLEDAP